MTSSYSNIIGTPRDQIPDISDTNWEDTSADLSEAANESITNNQNELKEFLQGLGQIEKQMATDNIENASKLKDFLGEGAKFKKVLDADKDSRETLKKFRKLDKNAKDKLKELEDLSELTDTELTEQLRKIAFNEKTGEVDEQALEFLKLQYFPTGEEIDLDGINEAYNKHAASAYNTKIEDNFIYSAATQDQANGISDKAVTSILTKYYIDLDAKGIDRNSREAQKYVNRHLLPELAKEQAAAIATYKQTTLRRYYAGTEKKKKSIILDAATSTTVTELEDGTKRVVHDGNFNNAILKIQKIDGVNAQEAIQIFLDTLPSVKNKLTRGGLEYLLHDVKIAHPAAKDGFIIGFDSPEADDLLKGNIGNVVELERLQSEVTQTKKAIKERIDGGFENFFRENTVENGGTHLINTANGKNKVMKKVDEYIKEMESKGFDVDGLEIPDFFFGDETVDNNVDLTAKANTFKDINNQTWIADWQSELDKDGELPLEGTRDIQVLKAKQYLYAQLELARADTPSLNVAGWMDKNYPLVIAKLVKGDFKPDENDILILPKAERIKEEADKFKKNPEKWLNNTEVNSIEEQQGMLEGVKWRNNNFQGPMPGYLKIVGEANDMSGILYLETRLKAMNMWNEKDENFKNPEDALKLSKEQLKTLTIRPNFTKNHLILNPTDEDRTAEGNVLKILRKDNENRKVDHVGVKSGIDGNTARLALDWLTPGTEVRTVGKMYELAKSGKYDDFGIYGLTAEELIQAVDSGVVDLNDDFNENTQDFLAINLIRVKANQQTSIQGAVTEGYDWRRLINLNRAEKAAVLKFFPNLRGMSINQFQDLQPDISLAILSDVEKAYKNMEAGESGIVGKPEYGTFTKEYIQSNPALSFMNRDISEENIELELKDNSDAIVEYVLGGSSTPLLSQEDRVRQIKVRLYFQKRIEEHGVESVPKNIRQMLQGTRPSYLNVPMSDKTTWHGFGDFPRYTDKFDYLNYSPQNTEEKK